MLKPKVLFFDIETFPITGLAWSKWETNLIEIVEDWALASFAYKWQGDKEIKCESQKNLTERGLSKKLWALFDAADIIIAHNGDRFDNKKSKTKFLEYDLSPPSPYKTIDTLKIAKSQFAFTSNSLNDLAKFLGIGCKEQTGGFKLWQDCMDGDNQAWDKMIKYNKQDVLLLEKVYDKLKPWATNHPHMGALSGDRSLCPICASAQVQCRGWTIAKVAKKRRMQCQACSHWWAA